MEIINHKPSGLCSLDLDKIFDSSQLRRLKADVDGEIKQIEYSQTYRNTAHKYDRSKEMACMQKRRKLGVFSQQIQNRLSDLNEINMARFEAVYIDKVKQLYPSIHERIKDEVNKHIKGIKL